MTFKERFLSGGCSIDAIDDWVKLWHCGYPVGQPLSVFLGLTEEEYSFWMAHGNDALATQLAGAVEPKYIAFHLEWDDLGDQLQDLVGALLGPDYEIAIRRVDYYYWDLKIDIPMDIDEELSGQICKKLALQDVEADCFIWDEELDNNCLNDLLSKLVHHEVDSNHADEEGVWIICKERITPPQQSEVR